jgi:hypothetical protein
MFLIFISSGTAMVSGVSWEGLMVSSEDDVGDFIPGVDHHVLVGAVADV